MKHDAEIQLHREMGNWLSRGRSEFVELSLQRAGLRPKKAMQLLDVGAGSGAMLPVLHHYGAVDVVEMSEQAKRAIKHNFPFVREIIEQGIPELVLRRKYDAIIACDVIEHIENDRAALEWLADHLKPGGLLVVTVPAYQWLFSDHDRANQHYRRYTVASLKTVIPESLQTLQKGYFVCFLLPAAIMSRGLWMIMKRLRAGGPKGSADHKQNSSLPKLVDTVFGKILSIEANIIACGAKLPFGLTAFTILRRDF